LIPSGAATSNRYIVVTGGQKISSTVADGDILVAGGVAKQGITAAGCVFITCGVVIQRANTVAVFSNPGYCR